MGPVSIPSSMRIVVTPVRSTPATASSDGTDHFAFPRKTTRMEGLETPFAARLLARGSTESTGSRRQIPLPQVGHRLAAILLRQPVDEQQAVHVIRLVLEDPG